MGRSRLSLLTDVSVWLYGLYGMVWYVYLYHISLYVYIVICIDPLLVRHLHSSSPGSFFILVDLDWILIFFKKRLFIYIYMIIIILLFLFFSPF